MHMKRTLRSPVIGDSRIIRSGGHTAARTTSIPYASHGVLRGVRCCHGGDGGRLRIHFAGIWTADDVDTPDPDPGRDAPPW